MNDLEINQAFLRLAELCLPCDEDVSKNLNPIRNLNEDNLRTALAVTMAQLARAQNRLRKAMPLAIEARLIQTIVLNEELHGTNIDEICLGNLSDDDLYKIAMRDSEFDTTYEPDLKYGIDLSVFRSVNELIKLKRSQVGKDGADKKLSNCPANRDKKLIKALFMRWQNSEPIESFKFLNFSDFANQMMHHHETKFAHKVVARWCTTWNKEREAEKKRKRATDQ